MIKVPKSQNNNKNLGRANEEEEECHYIKVNKKKINIIVYTIN